MKLVVTRLRVEKPGFRATISRDLFVWDEEQKRAVAGPFSTRSLAERARDELKAKAKESSMSSKRTVEEKTRKVEEQTEDDPRTQDSDEGSLAEDPTRDDEATEEDSE